MCLGCVKSQWSLSRQMRERAEGCFIMLERSASGMKFRFYDRKKSQPISRDGARCCVHCWSCRVELLAAIPDCPSGQISEQERASPKAGSTNRIVRNGRQRPGQRSRVSAQSEPKDRWQMWRDVDCDNKSVAVAGGGR